MTYTPQVNCDLTNDQWDEMVALKNAININPASVHPEKMELFTALFVKSLEGKGDVPVSKLSHNT